jgi:hypothetical protein
MQDTGDQFKPGDQEPSKVSAIVHWLFAVFFTGPVPDVCARQPKEDEQGEDDESDMERLGNVVRVIGGDQALQHVRRGVGNTCES